MRAALVYMGTTSGTTDALNLGEYTSSGKNALTLEVQRAFRTGTVGALTVEQSSDNITWTTLHDFADLSDIAPRTFYDWDRYLRLNVTYTEDATAEDPGLRVGVGVHVFGPPSWNAVKVCRAGHLCALFPAVVDTNKAFQAEWPEQADAAKREIELVLRAKQVDPYTIFTDGHASEPVPEGLESAGAALTIYLLLGSGAAVYGEGMKDARAHFREVYENQLETWLLGMAQVDKAEDGKPDPEDNVSLGLEMRW